MLLSTNRHVGLDLQAELDDARAEIQDLIVKNIRLRANVETAVRDSNRQREHYEEEIEKYEIKVAKRREQITGLKNRHSEQITYLKNIAQMYMGVVYNRDGAEHYKDLDPDGHHAQLIGYTPHRWPPPPPLPPSSLNQQAAQTNPYAIA